MINLDNLKNDPYYYRLYLMYGEDYIFEAGYFETNNRTSYSIPEIKKSLPLLTTSLPDISKINENSVILLNTGCYNPFHDGHLNLMLEAKKQIESLGKEVLAAYFAPGADEYVKYKSPIYQDIYTRLAFIEDYVKDYDWIYVDPWAALYHPDDINFSVIYKRLELYVKKYLGVEIPIYYVCGSDRAGFRLTFPDNTIVVERGGYKIDKTIENYVSENVVTQSSTELRKNWSVNPNEKQDLCLRVDEISIKSIKILLALSKHFRNIKLFLLEEQKEIFNDIGGNVISLDSILKSNYNIEMSRFFDISGNLFKKHSNRIGSSTIEEQIKLIDTSKQYTLFDDDTSTGRTFDYIKSLLPGCIIDTKTLISPQKAEILDLRDFYFGENCGLSIITPDGQKMRVPYIMPFVNVNKRCSIHDAKKFSLQIWEILFEHYLESDETVGSSNAYNVLKYVGFNDDTLLSEVCLNYYKLLK